MKELKKASSTPAGKAPIRIVLNGTSRNPFHRFGIMMNPVPQYSHPPIRGRMIALNKLGADPIPREDPESYIRNLLRGWHAEIVDLAVQSYRPGERVEFVVYVGREYVGLRPN